MPHALPGDADGPANFAQRQRQAVDAPVEQLLESWKVYHSHMPEKISLRERIDQIERINLDASRRIIENPAVYPPGSLGQQWAQMVLDESERG